MAAQTSAETSFQLYSKPQFQKPETGILIAPKFLPFLYGRRMFISKKLETKILIAPKIQNSLIGRFTIYRKQIPKI